MHRLNRKNRLHFYARLNRKSDNRESVKGSGKWKLKKKKNRNECIQLLVTTQTFRIISTKIKNKKTEGENGKFSKFINAFREGTWKLTRKLFIKKCIQYETMKISSQIMWYFLRLVYYITEKWEIQLIKNSDLTYLFHCINVSFSQ